MKNKDMDILVLQIVPLEIEIRNIIRCSVYLLTNP